MDIDSNASEIESLMHQIQPEEGTCSSIEFINSDNDLATCFETDNDSWDQQFLASLHSQSTPYVFPSDPEEEEEELEPTQAKVRYLSEAIFNLKMSKGFSSVLKGFMTHFVLSSCSMEYCWFCVTTNCALVTSFLTISPCMESLSSLNKQRELLSSCNNSNHSSVIYKLPQNSTELLQDTTNNRFGRLEPIASISTFETTTAKLY